MSHVTLRTSPLSSQTPLGPTAHAVSWRTAALVVQCASAGSSGSGRVQHLDAQHGRQKPSLCRRLDKVGLDRPLLKLQWQRATRCLCWHFIYTSFHSFSCFVSALFTASSLPFESDCSFLRRNVSCPLVVLIVCFATARRCPSCLTCKHSSQRTRVRSS